MHALRSTKQALSRSGGWDSPWATHMIRMLYTQPHLLTRSHAPILGYHSAASTSSEAGSPSTEPSQNNRLAITSFLSPPGTEKHHNPYETVADTLHGKIPVVRSQTSFSTRSSKNFDPVSPRLMMNDAVNSKNSRQIWHTYTRLTRDLTKGPKSPFTAPIYFRILHCFQSSKLKQSAEWALRIYKDMIIYHKPRIATLNTMLDILIRHQDVDGAISFFMQEAERFRIQPNVRSYNIMIRGLAVHGNLPQAQKMYEDMRSCVIAVKPDVITYSTLISQYSQQRMQEEADRILGDMVKDKVKPNMWIFNGVIKRFVSKKDYDGARKAMVLMAESGLRPDVVTYSTLIDSYAQDGNEGAIAKIQSEMVENKVYANEHTVASTIKVFARTGLDSDVDAQMASVLRSIPAGEMDDLTFGVLANVYGKRRDLDAAMGIYQHISSKGRIVNDAIVNTILDGYVKADQIPTANKIFHQHFTTRRIRPKTAWTYSVMISGCCRQDNLEDALHYYHEMSRFRIEPDATTCSRLLQLYLSHHQLDGADHMLRVMRNGKLPISVHTFTMMMDYVSRHRDLRGSLRYYQEMLDEGVRPDVHCYTVLINAYLREKNYAGCDMTFARLLRDGLRPTLETLTSMVHVHSQQGNLEKVKEHWEAMAELGYLPDIKAFTLLMQTYAQSGNVEMVEFIYKDLVQKDFPVDIITLTSIISAYAVLPRLNVHRIEEVVVAAEEKELALNSEYFRILLDAFGQHRMPDRVVKTWQKLQSLETPLNWTPTKSNMLHLIEACRDRGYIDTLQSVWNTATHAPALRTRREDETGSGPLDSTPRATLAPASEVVTAYLNALMTHNRFGEIEQLLKESQEMGIKPRTEDLEILFTGLAQYGFLKKELDRIREEVIQRWPTVEPMVDQIIQRTHKI